MTSAIHWQGKAGLLPQHYTRTSDTTVVVGRAGSTSRLYCSQVNDTGRASEEKQCYREI